MGAAQHWYCHYFLSNYLLINRYSEAFNGDKDRVTLWGMSAGSVCISHLTLSKKTNKLFHQVIMQSGSAQNNWARNDLGLTRSLQYINELGCNSSMGSAAVKQCLKNVSVSAMQQLLNDHFDVFLDKEYAGTTSFAPHFDDNNFFQSSSFATMLAAAPKKRSMIGINSDE